MLYDQPKRNFFLRTIVLSQVFLKGETRLRLEEKDITKSSSLIINNKGLDMNKTLLLMAKSELQ